MGEKEPSVSHEKPENVSTRNLEKYQDKLIDLVTRQLTAHGAMLFAVLSGLFSLMRVIVNHTSLNLPPFSRFGYFALLWAVFTAVSYVVGRTLYWSQMLNASIYTNHLNKKQKNKAEKSFPNFYNVIHGKANEKIQKEEIIHPSKIFFTPKFSFTYFEKHVLISLVLTILAGSIVELVRMRVSAATLCGLFLFYITEIDWSRINAQAPEVMKNIKDRFQTISDQTDTQESEKR
jgi:hypothetical protein